MDSSLPALLPASLIVPLAALTAYLLGSIPFALVSSRLFGLADPRSYGSGNPGATNVLRSGNKKAALLTLVGDAAKGWLAVFAAGRLGLSDGAVALVALAVFCGHIFPVFLRFKGGKGVATAAGVLLGLDLVLGLATLAIWIVAAFAFRYSSLAALLAAAGAALLAAMMNGMNQQTLAVGIMAMMLIGKHWGNLQRLLAGSEPKIGGRKTAR